jgi:transcriptional regulator of acetoin/glycerol metabolism
VLRLAGATAEGGVIAEADLDLPPFSARSMAADHTASERAAIVDALRANDGRVTDAAKALGLSRATLYRKIKALGIELDG